MNNTGCVSAAIHNRKPLYRNDFESASNIFRNFLRISKIFKAGILGGKMTILADSLDRIPPKGHNITFL
jgi:hypothetical protein